ncbi:hypothetical protein CBOM_06913 [Ceraceosorus bombacis]|uniref:Uncharacterized protein n=1 Tax=Ceraceosorus bombacis TaxID=401625 RepID=A0A0P1BT06_9BASI|nr:hypothetical protein CBOM_06913 [Ceraceosorus bombacis]
MVMQTDLLAVAMECGALLATDHLTLGPLAGALLYRPESHAGVAACKASAL